MARMTRIALTLAAAGLIAAPAAARTIDGWTVGQKGPDCTMVSTFADDVSIGLILSPKTGELGFFTTLPHPNALGGQPATAVKLAFDSGDLTDWEDERASVVPGGDGDSVIATWGAAHSADLARAVGAASHVSVSVGGKPLGTYDLAGSPAAYRELTHCGSQLAAR